MLFAKQPARADHQLCSWCCSNGNLAPLYSSSWLFRKWASAFLATEFYLRPNLNSLRIYSNILFFSNINFSYLPSWLHTCLPPPRLPSLANFPGGGVVMVSVRFALRKKKRENSEGGNATDFFKGLPATQAETLRSGGGENNVAGSAGSVRDAGGRGARHAAICRPPMRPDQTLTVPLRRRMVGGGG